MTMFDNSGEINALSTRDALDGIMKMAKILEDNQSANHSLAGQPSFTEQAKDDMIKRALLTSDGKLAFVNS